VISHRAYARAGGLRHVHQDMTDSLGSHNGASSIPSISPTGTARRPASGCGVAVTLAKLSLAVDRLALAIDDPLAIFGGIGPHGDLAAFFEAVRNKS